MNPYDEPLEPWKIPLVIELTGMDAVMAYIGAELQQMGLYTPPPNVQYRSLPT